MTEEKKAAFKATMADPANAEMFKRVAERIEANSDDAGKYAIQALENRIRSLGAALESSQPSSDTDWYKRGLCAGLEIAINALKDEIRFVKLERGPIQNSKGIGITWI